MIKVFQTKVGPLGNCMNACIASLLEIPIKELPTVNPSSAFSFWADYDKWTKANDIIAIKSIKKPITQDPYIRCIVYQSNRGFGAHAVIEKNNVIMHDPHPGNPSFGIMAGKGYKYLHSYYMRFLKK